MTDEKENGKDKQELKTIPDMAWGTSKAIEAMKDGEIGDEITLEEMERITEESCRSGTHGRSHVASAINHVLSRHNKHWQWFRAEQMWRCCNPKESMEVVSSRSKSIAKRAKKSLRMLNTVDKDKLSDDDRLQIGLQQTANQLVMTSVGKPLAARLKKYPVYVEPDLEQLAKLVGKQEKGGE